MMIGKVKHPISLALTPTQFTYQKSPPGIVISGAGFRIGNVSQPNILVPSSRWADVNLVNGLENYF